MKEMCLELHPAYIDLEREKIECEKEKGHSGVHSYKMIPEYDWTTQEELLEWKEG